MPPDDPQNPGSQNQPEPQNQPDPQQPAPDNQQGFPNHGDVYPQPGGGGNQPDPQQQNQPGAVTREELEQFQQNVLTAIDKKLGSAQPSQQPSEQQPSNQPANDPGTSDFEEQFWSDPATALQNFKQEIVQEVQKTAKQETSAQQFWNRFYSEHTDLKDDDDLVQLTLNANMKDLAEMPVGEASTKLADLTRQRIMRYAGNNRQENGERQRPHTEGAEHRLPQQPPAEPEAPTSLGQVIKARRNARRDGTKKAVAS